MKIEERTWRQSLSDLEGSGFDMTAIRWMSEGQMTFWERLGVTQGGGGPEAPAIETHLVWVTPEKAALWAEHYRYKHQRIVRDHHVDRLALAMKNGTFETSEIHFYDYGEGAKLLNGAHRLAAIIRSQVSVWLVISLKSHVTDQGAREAYRRFDVGLMRGLSEVLTASEVPLDLGLSTGAAMRVASAAGLIYYRFDNRYWRSDRAHYRDYENVIGRVTEWAHEGREYIRALQMGRGGLRQQMWTRAVMAVALATYRHVPESAAVFWQDVARNSGLERGEPAHTMVNYLADATHEHADVNRVMRGVAVAWNAFYEKRRLLQIKVLDANAPIRIEGTPFLGGRKEGVETAYRIAPPIPELIGSR